MVLMKFVKYFFFRNVSFSQRPDAADLKGGESQDKAVDHQPGDDQGDDGQRADQSPEELPPPGRGGKQGKNY